MLFDLKGRRRHAVQATYLILAVLMGGGLVLFGIGGGTSGGLLDAFKGGGGSGGDSAVKKRIENEKKQLALNPNNEVVLKSLVRDNYQLAAANVDPSTSAFNKDAKGDLQQAGLYWQKYLATNPKKVDPSLASTMVQVYGDGGLNKPAQATEAAEVVAEAAPNANAYLQLARFAQLAGQTRKADLAGQKAVALAPKSQRSSVKALLKQIKAGGAQPTSTTGGGG
jgi:tetratricopeptide (TPR) repeat protein